MSEEHTPSFQFEKCFYYDRNRWLDSIQAIFNIVGLSAIALVIFGTLQGACNLDLIDQVQEILRSKELSPQDAINELHEFLGRRMQYNIGKRKLEAKNSHEDNINIISVDKIRQLHYGDSYDTYQGDIVALSLAHFNFSGEIIADGKWNELDQELGCDRLFLSLLNILQCQLNPRFRDSQGTAQIYSIPFKGSHVTECDYSRLRDIELRFTLSEVSVPQNGINDIIKNCIEYLNAIAQMTDGRESKYNKDIETQSLRFTYCAPITSNNNCDSVKESLREHPYIVLFVIAAAALLAGGAVALTTYFHVGTSLMLAAGFIPFLNFVGGFQISLLLGVVTAATLGAGGIYAIVKNTKCCDKCLKDNSESSEYDPPLEPKRKNLFDQSNFTN